MTRAAAVEGFTVMQCSASGCTASGSLPQTPDTRASAARGSASDVACKTLAAMRECVRSSSGGVLVSTGCTVGQLACRLRPPGPVLLVQPCDAQRQPTYPAVRVGPLCTDDDVTAVQDWLRARRLDPALLPQHLTGLHRATRMAATN